MEAFFFSRYLFELASLVRKRMGSVLGVENVRGEGQKNMPPLFWAYRPCLLKEVLTTTYIHEQPVNYIITDALN